MIGQLTGSIALHFITVASEIYTTDDSVFLMRSAADNEVMIVLAESQPYFKELEDAMKQFTTPETLMQPMLMEVFTDKEKDTTLLREYYHGLKNKPNE